MREQCSVVIVIKAVGNNTPRKLSAGLLATRNALIAHWLVWNTLECSSSCDEGMILRNKSNLVQEDTSIFHVPASAGMLQ